MQLSVLVIVLWSAILVADAGTPVASYNQPALCPNANWILDTTVFANNEQLGKEPIALSIDKNNTVYSIDRKKSEILMWTDGKSVPRRLSTQGLKDSTAMFVSNTGDVYIAMKEKIGMSRWASQMNTFETVMNVEESCFAIFVDRSNTIYCSMHGKHKILKWCLDGSSARTEVAIGTGEKGTGDQEFDGPTGIFVDENFDLYVADEHNARIQKFSSGKQSGTTVVGANSFGSAVTLKSPTGVILDAQKDLFIMDHACGCIIRSSSTGFQCVIGCDGKRSQHFSLDHDSSLIFDMRGNILVVDPKKTQIYRLSLATKSCGPKTTSSQQLVTSHTSEMRTSESSTAYSTLTNASNSTLIASSMAVGSSSMSTVTSTRSILATILQAHTDTITITHRTTTTNNKPITAPSEAFVPSNPCAPSTFGVDCNHSNSHCLALKPCRNNGSCNDINDHQDFNCTCPSGFAGKRCESDLRPCKRGTCLNGVCNETTHDCTCTSGWVGFRCEQKVNHCENVTCRNGGICRLTPFNYTCDCLTSSYSGRHCETVAKKIITRHFIAKFIGLAAVIALVIVILFVVVMDMLKYCFGIDPTRGELRRLRQEKRAKRRAPVIERCVYTNAPQPSSQFDGSTRSNEMSLA